MRRIAVLLVATATAAPLAAHDLGEPPRGCEAIEVTDPAARKQPRRLQFAATRILDLELETRLERPVHGDHVMHFKVFTPGGFLYQDIAVPFSWPKPGKTKPQPAEAVRPAASVAGLPVQQLGTVGRHGRIRDTVSARLPVAGTSITMSTLYGRWTVQAFLDDRPRPCSPLRRFTIRAD